ncbi:MAG: amino acid ABC transporter substrate-binding protein, partial [Gammaproteobacteria bacterium]|nr:amino acid ABC transporter substrate-binding protein [Gammaproteobacteria bacterium]
MLRLLCVVLGLWWTLPGYAGVLDEVRERGRLRCGVSEGIPGFSTRDQDGHWRGLDADFCRAVAIVALGDAGPVDFVPLDSQSRFHALKSERIDLLARNSTWTLWREENFGIAFAGINYFDGQGFMVSRASGIRSALEIDDLNVCVKKDTTSELNAYNWFNLHGVRARVLVVENLDAMRAAYESGRCEVLSSDQSQLHGLKTLLKEPDAVRVLPEYISKEPLGPAVLASDPRWLQLVKLTLAVMV